jgi:RNA polymerase-binding transcription factor DksA
MGGLLDRFEGLMCPTSGVSDSALIWGLSGGGPPSIVAGYAEVMNPDQLAIARASLEAERRRLSDDLALPPETPAQMTYGSQAAAASEVFAQQRDLALRGKSGKGLELVDSALARLAAGTYGPCQRCGRPIPDERLEVLPWAAFCLACQQLEKDGR